MKKDRLQYHLDKIHLLQSQLKNYHMIDADKEFLLKTASGNKNLEFECANWYDTTLCISSKMYKSQVDDDGVFREYQTLVRLLHNDKFELVLIDVCECGVNILDKWPDNSKHPSLPFRNQTVVFKFLFDKCYPMDLNVRYY